VSVRRSHRQIKHRPELGTADRRHQG
jgi:hypothetical protein